MERERETERERRKEREKVKDITAKAQTEQYLVEKTEQNVYSAVS